MKTIRENVFTVLYVFIEKHPHISGPTHFKPILFKGQLYRIKGNRLRVTTHRPKDAKTI